MDFQPLDENKVFIISFKLVDNRSIWLEKLHKTNIW